MRRLDQRCERPRLDDLRDCRLLQAQVDQRAHSVGEDGVIGRRAPELDERAHHTSVYEHVAHAGVEGEVAEAGGGVAHRQRAVDGVGVEEDALRGKEGGVKERVGE